MYVIKGRDETACTRAASEAACGKARVNSGNGALCLPAQEDTSGVRGRDFLER